MYSQEKISTVDSLINSGEFNKAKELIHSELCEANLSAEVRYNLNFKLELMDRVKLDFKRTEEDVLNALRKYYPNIKSEDLRKWEVNNSLEMRMINGERRYFNNAVANLFRIDNDAKKIKESIDGIVPNKLTEFLSSYLPKLVVQHETEKQKLINPIKVKINYTLSVKPNVVPDGEMIKCWLPFPKETRRRQTEVKLISSSPTNAIVAPDEFLQRTIFLQQKSIKDKPTVFNVEYSFLSYAEFNSINEENFVVVPDDSITIEYTQERAPHIIFSDEIKKLSDEIVGDEKNHYRILKKIFTWISKNIPWTSALEYSTIPSLSGYCEKNRRGDCGIKAMLFVTLARLNGIPAKWQSGWMLHPGNLNLHDWAEVYANSIGWIPIDVDFGLQKSEKKKVKYFFLGNTDNYHFIVNDDFSQPFFPSKIFPRSETVDFQRGEVEWRGGNLYFDKWNYKMDVTFEEK
ncbi:MAG: cysteine protease [Chlorobiaceae bacterium]|nr:cysteine protease [Chlorobiaceae bacterium]MBA4309530.1 cysteine protease [Chlorobiaceae bacterium]